MPKRDQCLITPGSEVRAKEDSRTIWGYGAVFDSEAHNEIVRAGAFSKTLNDGADVKALFNHNPDIVLGSTKAGTLRLQQDEHGLRYEFDAPNTQWGDTVLENIRRQDVSMSSFAFEPVRTGRLLRDNMPPLRELFEVKLFDVSPVTYAWYEATQVSLKTVLRSLGMDPEEFAGLVDDVRFAETMRRVLREMKVTEEPTSGTTQNEPVAIRHSEAMSQHRLRSLILDEWKELQNESFGATA